MFQCVEVDSAKAPGAATAANNTNANADVHTRVHNITQPPLIKMV
jgi:hypothetical protein